MPDTTTLTLSFAANQLTATWAAVDGVSAYDFELLDADGLPVPGTSQYGLQVTTAQVSGNLVGNGLTYTAHVRTAADPSVAGGWYASATITILKVPAPANITMTYDGHALQVSWDAIAGAAYYNFKLLDATNHLVSGSEQNHLTVAHATVAGESLSDAQTYTADVQAIAESVWSAQSTVLDKIDPLLKALEQRLNAALVNQQVPLNAQTLDSQELTDLLALLVGADNPTLMVSRAQIFRGPNNSSINVTGQSVLPGNVQVTSVKAVFEVADNALTMKLPLALAAAWKFSDSFPELEYSFFDSLVIAAPYLALASLAYTYTSDDGSLQVPIQSGLNFFSRLSLTSNAADPLSPALQVLQSTPATTTLYGPITTAADGQHDFQFVSKELGVTASLNLYSISALALSAVSVEIASLHGLQPQFRDNRARLSATTNLGATERVLIQLPIAPNGWLISMVADSAAPLTMPALLPVVGGQGLTSLLPTSLQNAINRIAISELFIRFSMMSGTSTVIKFTVNSTAGWTVIPNVLTITQMQVSVNIEHDPATANYGGRTNFGGTINGTLTLSGIGIAVALEIPPSTGVDWDLKVAASDASFPTVAGLAQLLGGTDLDQAGLPPELGSPQGLTVAALEVLFNPFTPSLSSVYFTAEYTQSWQVGSGITFTDVLMNFNVDDPLNVNNSQLVWWAVAGSATIAGADLFAYIQSPTASDPTWHLQLSGSGQYLPSLSDMVTFAGGAQANSQVPQTLSGSGLFAIGGTDINLDATSRAINYLSLSVAAYYDWPIIPNVFSVQSVIANLVVTPAATSTVTGTIEGAVTLIGVPILVGAENIANAADGWTIYGEMQPFSSINLTDLVAYLLNKLLPGGFTLPAGFPVVSLVDVAVSFKTGTQAFYITGASVAIWNFGMGAATLAMASISASLDTGAAQSDGTRPYTFSAAGGFVFNGISTVIAYTTSNTANDTILSAQISNNNAAALSLPGM